MLVKNFLNILFISILLYRIKSQVVYENSDLRSNSRIWIDSGGSSNKRDLNFDASKQIIKYDGIPALCVPNVNSPTLSIPFNTDRRTTPELTMIVWLYRNKNRVRNNEWLLGHDDTSNGGFDRAILLYDNRFKGLALGVGYQYNSQIPTVGRNKWTFIAATFSNSQSKAIIYKGFNDYLNLFKQEINEHKTLSNRKDVTLFGLPQYGSSHTYSGCIGQIELIPRVLTEQQIINKFNQFRGKFPNLNGNQLIYNNNDLKSNSNIWKDTGNSGKKRDLNLGSKNTIKKYNNINALCINNINSPTLNINFNTDRRNTPELTMILWLFRDRPRVNTREWLLGHDDTSNGGYDRAIMLYDYRFKGMSLGVGYRYDSKIPTVPENKWTFVAATFSDVQSKATLYYGVNKQTLISQTINEHKTISNRIGVTLFGLPQYGNSHTYLGCIGQIMLYNKVLSLNEINNKYNSFKNALPNAHIDSVILSNNDLGKIRNNWKDSGLSFKKRNLVYNNDKTIKKFNGINALCMNNINSKTLSIPYNTDRRSTPELTMILWVYRNKNRVNNNEWLLGHDDTSNGGFDRAILLYDNRFKGLGLGVGYSYTSKIATAGNNQWTFIAATFSDSNGKATVYKGFNDYPNLFKQEVNEHKTLSNRKDVTVFGLPQYGTSHSFLGCIGEIQIINRVLTLQEIKNKYSLFRDAFPSISINQLILSNDDLTNNKWLDTGGNKRDLIFNNQHNIKKYNDINALCVNNINSAPLNIPFNTNRRNTPELTMILWVFRDRPRVNSREWLLGHDDTSNGGYDRAIMLYDYRFKGMSLGVGYRYDSTISSAPENKWTFIAATFSDITGKATLYKGLGGITTLKSQIINEHKTSSRRNDVTLFGLPQYGNTHTFLGCIGQVEMVNRALTKTQIESRYKEFKDALPNTNIDNIIYSNNDLEPGITNWIDSGDSFKKRDLSLLNDKTKTIELMNGVNGLCSKNKKTKTLSIPYNTDRRSTPELTMIIWVFREKIRKNRNEWLLGHDDTSNGGYDRAIMLYDYRFKGMSLGVGYRYDSTISTADYYKWTFIAATFSNSQGKAILYKGNKNINLKSQIINEHKTLSNRKDVTLFGLPQYGDTHTFVGCIGEVQLINRVLTRQEIEEKFQDFKETVPDSLPNEIIYSNYDLISGYNIWEDVGDSFKQRDLNLGNDKEIKEINGINGLCGKDINTKTLSINFNTDRRITPELTMIIWVLRNKQRVNTREWLLGHDDTSNGGYDRAIMLYDYRFKGMSLGVGYRYDSTISTAANNEWTFIAATFSDSQGKATLYKGSVNNNQLQTQSVNEHKTLSNREVVTLFGLPQYGNSHTFLGCIGEVQLVSKVLTLNEINAKFDEFKSMFVPDV